MTPDDRLWKRKQATAAVTLLCLTLVLLTCALLIWTQISRSEPFQMRKFFAEHQEEFIALGSQFDSGEFDLYETCNLMLPAPPEIRQWAGENARIIVAPIYEPDESGWIERRSFSLFTQVGTFYYIPIHIGELGGLGMCHYSGFCSQGFGSGWYRCIFTY